MVNKKGNAMLIGVSAVIGLVVMIIVGTIGAQVVQGVRDGTTTGTGARNVSDSGLSSFNNFGSLLPTTGTVVIASVLISLVIGAFGFALYRGMGQ